ncbi:bile acid:sodium symporter family protein [Brumimicrobium mesophilum]|uniref:bile acid:sodium symporter family protein n=1 Tax=Brumimicrobium mesophilum TaxID=392717 RepID=UPI000D13EFE9|nr:bile acid:sodium symporter family protein [Brumimicrobium mesophilum]
MQTFLDYLLPVSIAVIMFGIGLGLTVIDFKRVLISPKAVSFGLFGQLILMPLIGFGIAFAFDLDPIYQLGIVLIAACPGGTSSNIVTYMLNGRVALSVSMTACNSFLIILTIPFILNIAFSYFWTSTKEINLSMLETFKDVLLTVFIPVILGLIARHYFPIFIGKLRKPLRFILPGIMFLVFLLVLINEKENGDKSMIEYWDLLLPALCLNVLVMFVGFLSSGAAGINHEGKYTIAIEMGLQNSALAIFLANNVIQIDGLSLIAVLYGGFSFFTTLIIAWFMKRYMKKEVVAEV